MSKDNVISLENPEGECRCIDCMSSNESVPRVIFG
jgi:hypothetical protein